MADPIRLKDKYVLARCCCPTPGDDIVGYHSHHDLLKVHRADCKNLSKAEADRLVPLAWSDILAQKSFEPGPAYHSLDETDFAVLLYHHSHGIDYSLMVAKALRIDKQEAFDRHKKLKALKLLIRVPAVMVSYHEKELDHKWIKHRNHTYYDLTEQGRVWLKHYLASG